MARKMLLIVLAIAASLFTRNASASSACVTAADISKSEADMWLNGTEAGQRNLILCIDRAWQGFERKEKFQSAEFVGDASRDLIAALKFNASDFVKIMESHQWLLDRWLRNIEFDIFTWRENPPCGYLAQIEDIRSVLRNVSGESKKTSSYRKLMSRFEAVSCSQVN